MQTYVTNAATVLIFGIFCPLSLARRSAAESLTRFDAQKWDESSLATAQKDPPQSKRSLERSAAASADALGETGKGTANYFIVIGIIETVALFTLVFSLLLLQ